MAEPIVGHKMRNLAYHESALLYNKKMAETARELVLEDDMVDKDVKRWCMSQAQQHEKHIPFHERAVRRLRKQKPPAKKKPQEKKVPRNNSRTRKSSKPGPQERKERTIDHEKQPARPIPRDPRLSKRPAVGTSIPQEKQESA